MSQADLLLTAAMSQMRPAIAMRLANLQSFAVPYVEGMTRFLTQLDFTEDVDQLADLQIPEAVRRIGAHADQIAITFHAQLLRLAYDMTEPYMNAIKASESDKSAIASKMIQTTTSQTPPALLDELVTSRKDRATIGQLYVMAARLVPDSYREITTEDAVVQVLTMNRSPRDYVGMIAHAFAPAPTVIKDLLETKTTAIAPPRTSLARLIGETTQAAPTSPLLAMDSPHPVQ